MATATTTRTTATAAFLAPNGVTFSAAARRHRTAPPSPIIQNQRQIFEGNDGANSNSNAWKRKRRISASSSTTSTALFRSLPVDLDVTFGSANTSSSTGVSWGDYDEDDDVDDDDGYVGATMSSHQERVDELLQSSDREYRQQRKQTKWGNFANVTSNEELKEVLEKERRQIEKENAAKAKYAAQYGVEFTLLEPIDNDEFEPESDIGETNKNIKIETGSARRKAKSFFAEMDADLEDEWRALTENDDGDEGTADEDGDGDDDFEVNGEGEEEDDDDDGASPNGDNKVELLNDNLANDVKIESSTGKVVARDALKGVRVGSAGGWSLEVFPGDYVVHRKYGIGKFERTCLRPKTRLTDEELKARDTRRGEILASELRKLGKMVTPAEIQQIRSKFGTDEDDDPVSNPQTTVLEVSYADAVVHVPVDRAYRLSRYRAGDAVVKPKLSRVRGEAWSRAKRRVEENTLELAQDVLALYATRETLQRPPFDPSLEAKVQQFAQDTFPYEPTPDQLRTFEDVENDMIWRRRPMDRLVCGDVGFGKTEAAIRALFRSVKNGRQCALLAPTGVLAAQHYRNILKRMGPDTPYGVEVALLRGGMGKATKAGREIRERIASGQVQLVVGTHALLSNEMQFNDLGLLVVDEEQRFGVKQKERLKLICEGVDVLTLTATPIPRTLQMSLSGIRDTSTIRSPPPMRKPTITYVQEFDEELVELAIGTELKRGGQCYYVVPRISMLDEAESTIKRLFPSIRVVQAHGRMHRNGAEENVAKFAEGEFDVLLATTVIENGVDIPAVNTIVVENSQSFGMSTLYQLRGRVGRSDRQAFAYFLHRGETTTEQAAMRLQAIGELSELGSGFDVANRDLEIRGAGSLLGTEQSGMAAKVGFDLYMRMLKKSIRKLRGLDLPLVPRTNVLLQTIGTPDAFEIPETFIPNAERRREEESKARLSESTASLVNLTASWKEEFGPLPSKLQNQLKTMHLHACTRRVGIDLVGMVDVYGDGTRVDCVLRSPGLRPRHWATIAEQLPRGAAKGLDVCFPGRFTASGEDLEISGSDSTGNKGPIDLEALLTDESLSEDREDEEGWDALDREELEAMKDISSAVNVKDMDEIDLDQYPRFVLKNFGKADSPKAVDRLLKVLLPIAKVVYETQQSQADAAKEAADLRQRQELLRTRKRQNEALESQRLGYQFYNSDAGIGSP